LEPILIEAARVKVDVVSRDEREAGLRRVLNLGHTFGHALEEATEYRRFLHGEAVAWGILVVARLAELLGVLKPAEGERIANLVRRVGALPRIRDMKAEYLGYENNLRLVEDVSENPDRIFRYLPPESARAFALYRRHFNDA
jgi:3-dehydroquinate synthase